MNVHEAIEVANSHRTVPTFAKNHRVRCALSWKKPSSGSATGRFLGRQDADLPGNLPIPGSLGRLLSRWLLQGDYRKCGVVAGALRRWGGHLNSQTADRHR